MSDFKARMFVTFAQVFVQVFFFSTTLRGTIIFCCIAASGCFISFNFYFLLHAAVILQRGDIEYILLSIGVVF